MIKHKAEILIFIILIPILAYVGWQAYNSYFKTPEVEELEKAAKEEPVTKVTKPVVEEPPAPPAPKGTLDFTGFAERDPLKTALPIKEKAGAPKEMEKPAGEKPAEIPKKGEPPKEIALPTFAVTGIVWGHSPRVIIDDCVYKIGDEIKGAKILDITNKGVLIIYEGKKFLVTLRGGLK